MFEHDNRDNDMFFIWTADFGWAVWELLDVEVSKSIAFVTKSTTRIGPY